ncbi:hypothetical protein [Mycobacterium sp. IS-1742]|uniref:hypothetical protein n=1 Tax=Mycobacterium sp. IS-1742 TaxID=1772285 RepID=UPI000A4E2A98|nr:hypothetical protein [Mycobacterium sp. IS-1742]
MMFPAGWAKLRTSAILLTAALLTAAPGAAQPPPPAPPPPLHHVKYTVTSQQPHFSKVYWRENDPTNFAEYSHNPYVFSPKAEVDIGPGQPWIREVWLADPYHWAMVTATSELDPVEPMFSCTLEVDGAVVATNEGPKGALCSLRHW